MSTSEAAPSRRGRPPRIGRRQIIDVAKALSPDDLTMQAVAEELGVHRKAIHYHVDTREGLLSLVATDRVDSHLASVRVTPDLDWRGALTVLAEGFRDAILAAGAFATYYRFDSSESLASVEPVEATLRALIDAGCARSDATRAVAFVASMSMAFARDLILAAEGGRHPQVQENERARDLLAARFPLTLGMLDIDTFAIAQFAFELQTVLTGLAPLVGPPPAAVTA